MIDSFPLIEPAIHIFICVIIGFGIYSLVFRPREQERI